MSALSLKARNRRLGGFLLLTLGLVFAIALVGIVTLN